MKLELEPKMSIKRLRKEHPHLAWSIIRRGFAGMTYRGVGTGVDVHVMRVAMTLFDEFNITPGNWMVSGNGANRGFELYAFWKGGR